MQKDNASLDPTGDSFFMEDVARSIASRHGESIIRAKFRAYITKFTRIAAMFEETVYGASALHIIPPTESDTLSSTRKLQSGGTVPRTSAPELLRSLKGHGYVWPSEEAKNRELACSASRIEGWRNTRSYYSFISDLASHHSHVAKSPTSPTHPASKPGPVDLSQPRIDLYHALSRLRTLKLTPSEAGAIYSALSSYCTDSESILELLELTPISEAGLFYVSLGLWHEERRVREAVADLLDRIRKHECGKHFYNRVGGWVSMGFKRCWQEREARLEEEEAAEGVAPGMDKAGRGS